MSERDLRRIEVLSDVRAGRRTVASAAAVLAISGRQAFRLLARYEADGGQRADPQGARQDARAMDYRRSGSARHSSRAGAAADGRSCPEFVKAKDPRPSSHHRWFEQRGDACTLLVFIDDATSKLMQLRFVPSESTDSYFELYDFADRPLEVRWKGHSLPYRVFSKDQRVSHTATVENKRLGHALTLVKAQQETRRLQQC